MESASSHRLSPNYSKINLPRSLSTLFSKYVDRFLLPTTYGTVSQTSYSWISSLKLLHDDWFTEFLFTALVLTLRRKKYNWLLGCLFVTYSGRFLIVFFGWRSTRFWLAADNVLRQCIAQQCPNVGYTSTIW